MILEIVTNSIFYAAVFPIGLVVTFFGLILAYWTSKWWLIKYCSIPKYSYRLGRLAVNYSSKLDKHINSVSLHIRIRIRAKFSDDFKQSTVEHFSPIYHRHRHDPNHHTAPFVRQQGGLIFRCFSI